MRADTITAKDVSYTRGHETNECSVIVGNYLVRHRYIGYTKREAIRRFVAYVNNGGR